MFGSLWTARLIFVLSGVGLAAWAVLVPYAKIKFHLSDADLGSVLFLASIGGVLAPVLAGPIVARWGSRSCAIITLLLMCLLLPLLAWAPLVSLFVGFLFLDSAVFGVLDVSINAQGALVEKLSGRLRMSSFHASFSLGTLIAALMASILIKIDWTVEWLCLLFVFIILAGLTQSFRLLPKTYDSPRTAQSFVVPNRHTVVLGLCCFAEFMCEGATTDWSTVFLHFSRHLSMSEAVLGYAAFTVAMTLARLTGDRMAEWFGQSTLMRLGVALAMLGFAVAIFVPFGIAGIVGFGLVGFGAGNITPLVFSAVSRVPGMAAHHSMSMVVGIGYVGFLAGPVIMGLVSSHFGLGAAFGLDAVFLGLSSFAARYVVK